MQRSEWLCTKTTKSHQIGTFTYRNGSDYLNLFRLVGCVCVFLCALAQPKATLIYQLTKSVETKKPNYTAYGILFVMQSRFPHLSWIIKDFHFLSWLEKCMIGLYVECNYCKSRLNAAAATIALAKLQQSTHSTADGLKECRCCIFCEISTHRGQFTPHYSVEEKKKITLTNGKHFSTE